MGHWEVAFTLRGAVQIVIKNTLKTFWLSHDVGNVSVVSVTNKSTQEHFGVPDSVSRITCLILPVIVCGGGTRSAKP
jgi:hypothetical protein